MVHWRYALCLSCSLFVVACGDDDGGGPDGGPRPDAAATDFGVDATVDAGGDGGPADGGATDAGGPRDSDGDGLSDAEEEALGTDPEDPDTDGDGASDLAETVLETDPTDMDDAPGDRGQLPVTVPFEGDPSTVLARFRTDLRALDVYVLFDISGSLGGEITAMQENFADVIDQVSCAPATGGACDADSDCPASERCDRVGGSCVPTPTGPCVPSVHSGAGFYEDTYEHRLSIQPDASAVETEMGTWSTYGGTEMLYGALVGVADPSASEIDANGCATAAGTVGCPGFRSGALRVVVALTDEDSDGSTTAAQVGSALSAVPIDLIGVNTGGSASGNALSAAVTATGTLTAGGDPLVVDASDGAVVDATADLIESATVDVLRRVTLTIVDEPGDGIDTLDLIAGATANISATDCATATVEPVTDLPDALADFEPGGTACWDLAVAANTTVTPADEPRTASATLRVAVDGAPVDERELVFIVP